jgi:hypothetical protein
MPFKSILINRFEMPDMNVWLCSDSGNKPLMKGSINMYDIGDDNPSKSSLGHNFDFTALECNVSNINYSIPGVYQTIQIKKLLLDSRKGILKIDSLNIVPQNSRPEFADNAKYHLNGFATTISSIEILKLDVMGLLNKKFIAGSIHVNGGIAHIVKSAKMLKSSQPQAVPVSYLTQIPEEVRIDTFNINHFSLEFTGFSKADLQPYKNAFDSGQPQNFSIKYLEITKVDLAVYPGNKNQFNIERLNVSNFNGSKSRLHFDAVTCSLANIKYAIPGSYRTMRLKKLIMDSRKGSLFVDSLGITTQYPKFEFGRKLGRQADFLEAVFPRIEILGLNTSQLLQNKLVADKLIIDNTKAYFFRDRRLPREQKKQPMPNDYFKQLPLDVRINLFQLNNASIVSEEFPKKGTQSGMIKIERLNLSMSPILNNPGKTDPEYSTTSMEGLIMKAGIIQATIRAPLEKNIYFIQGVIKNLDLPKLNASSENLGNFHIESGVLNTLDFQFTATEKKASGKIIGEYHDLVIDRLKDKNGEKEVAKVPTFFLKHVIIPKNKDKSMAVAKRTGDIDYDRDPTRLVTFYLLKALLSGIRSSFDLGFLLPE